MVRISSRRIEKPIDGGGGGRRTVVVVVVVVVVVTVRRTVMLQKRVRVLSRAYFFRELPEHAAAAVAIGEPRVH